MAQQSFIVRTHPRAFEEVTGQVNAIVRSTGLDTGICHVFLRHTSASLLICENADPSVRADLERFMQRVAPDGSAEYEHDTEGPDDMPAHIRSTLAGVSVTVPCAAGRLLLGAWQGIYLWEHRTTPHQREIIVTVLPA